MSPELSSNHPGLAAGHLARGDPSAGEPAQTAAKVAPQSETAADDHARAEMVAIEVHDDCRRRRFTSPLTRRLGHVEYALLALIAFGVAVTLVMAIVNP